MVIRYRWHDSESIIIARYLFSIATHSWIAARTLVHHQFTIGNVLKFGMCCCIIRHSCLNLDLILTLAKAYLHRIPFYFDQSHLDRRQHFVLWFTIMMKSSLADWSWKWNQTIRSNKGNNQTSRKRNLVMSQCYERKWYIRTYMVARLIQVRFVSRPSQHVYKFNDVVHFLKLEQLRQ